MIPPFIENESDELHCAQSVYRMMRGACEGEVPTLRESELATGFLTDTLTWPFAGMLDLCERGYRVTWVENFEVDLFFSDPLRALSMDFQSEEEAMSEIKSLDVEMEQLRLRRLSVFESFTHVTKDPDTEALVELVRNGLLCNVYVNAYAVMPVEKRTTEKSLGHAILVYDVCEDGIVAHNPGPPAQMSQRLGWSELKAAQFGMPGSFIIGVSLI